MVWETGIDSANRIGATLTLHDMRRSVTHRKDYSGGKSVHDRLMELTNVAIKAVKCNKTGGEKSQTLLARLLPIEEALRLDRLDRYQDFSRAIRNACIQEMIANPKDSPPYKASHALLAGGPSLTSESVGLPIERELLLIEELSFDTAVQSPGFYANRIVLDILSHPCASLSLSAATMRSVGLDTKCYFSIEQLAERMDAKVYDTDEALDGILRVDLHQLFAVADVYASTVGNEKLAHMASICKAFFLSGFAAGNSKKRGRMSRATRWCAVSPRLTTVNNLPMLLAKDVWRKRCIAVCVNALVDAERQRLLAAISDVVLGAAAYEDTDPARAVVSLGRVTFDDVRKALKIALPGVVVEFPPLLEPASGTRVRNSHHMKRPTGVTNPCAEDHITEEDLWGVDSDDD